MRLLLVHNPTAGDRQLRREELVALCEDAGWMVHYQSTHEQRWEEAMVRGAHDLVVAAGGDGTVRKVATWLAAARSATPLAVVPLGTANNVARSVGITGAPPELAAGWQNSASRPFDVGVLRAPWAATRFVESVGVGLFAQMIRLLRSDCDFKLRSHARPVDADLALGLEVMQRLLRRTHARRLRIRLDDRTLDGDYLLVEAMNVPVIGPRLALAPHADPSDGMLDLVLVRADERETFAAYLAARLRGIDDSPLLSTHRGRRLRLEWDGAPLHRDDGPWPRGGAERRRRREAARRRPRTLRVRMGRPIRLLAAR